MVRLHPVTLEQEVAVDVEVARFIAGNLSTESLDNLGLVEVLADVAESGVAEVTLILALATDIVDVLTGPLVRAENGVVAVNRSRNARPDTLAVVAVLDQGLAARESIVHGLASGFVNDAGPATITAGHWAVRGVLVVAVGETIANQRSLDVDVALLV